MFQDVLRKLTAKEDLTADEAYSVIIDIKNDELSDVQIAGFQVALLMKGPTITEITAIARAMRDHCNSISPKVSDELMDTCGTGGGLSTFNISTAVALVAAAAGIPVAKHGSRSISSLSGSADVLEALGVEINLSPKGVEKLIEEIGIAFIFAPLFHPVMHKVLPPEQALGIKTIFYTIIGPLINPAKATRHILGVYKPELLDVVAQIALSLGYTRGLFVHGMDGLDEISLLGKTRINEIKNGSISTYEIAPEDFGFARCTLKDICTGTPEVNAGVIRDVFSGRDKGPRRQAVILNAAGALMIGGKANSFAEGIQLAGEIIASGAARDKLQQLVTASQAFRSVA
ncbi:MAG: anthranilate phosphoribosyltransferase [Desulfotomaculaceae bacterium]